MGKGEHLGEFEQVVLLSLARLDGHAPGRSIYDELVEVTGRDVSVAAVYITLSRLEGKGLVVSSNAAEGRGRSLKVFRLEPAGGRALQQARDQMNRLWRGARMHPYLKG